MNNVTMTRTQRRTSARGCPAKLHTGIILAVFCTLVVFPFVQLLLLYRAQDTREAQEQQDMHRRSVQLHTDISETYIVAPNFAIPLPSNGLFFNGTFDTTLVTHTTLENLKDVVETSTAWAGPISLSVFLREDLDNPVIRSLIINAIEALGSCPSIAKRVSIHLAAPPDMHPGMRDIVAQGGIFHWWSKTASNDCNLVVTVLDRLYQVTEVQDSKNYAHKLPYPGNALRSIARNLANTPLSMVLDIDMIPMPRELFRIIQLVGEREHIFETGKKIALVLPAFEVKAGATIPQTKRALQSAYNVSVQPFYFDLCWKCHKPTNYPEWLGSSRHKNNGDILDSTYPVSYIDPWEPFYVARTGDGASHLDHVIHDKQMLVPDFDTRFKQYGFNRISQICAMHMSGFDFHVLREGFVAHRGYKTKGAFHATKEREQNENRLIFRKYKEELKRQYPGSRRCNLYGRHV
eukprot:m.41946 g.41946  ORF g.41946 m.41946 type:complete len:462 (-) comp14985_c0_seq6:2484-3869(-)